MRRSLLLLPFLTACTLATAQSLHDVEVRAELSTRLCATLDDQRHYFATDAERDAFARRLQQVARVTGDARSYYQGLADELASLDEGHTGLVASAEVPFTSTIPPVAILEVDGWAVVAGVAPGVESGGLQAGDVILRIDGIPAREALEQRVRVTSGSTVHGRRARAAANLLAGPTDTPAEVHVRGPDGRERVCFPLRFLLDDEGEDRFRFGFVPNSVRAARITSTAGYVALPDFQPERRKELEHSLNSLANMDSLVLDLRGNPGGRIRTLQRVAGMFLSGPEDLLELRSGDRRDMVPAEIGTVHFDGELTILIDERTGSAAELLAAALQDLGRARIVGRRTAGSTRSRRSSILPGGVIFHYAGRAEFRRRDGRAVEGVGVKPDVIVLPSRTDLARGAYGDPGRDPVVRYALGLN